MIFLTGDVHNLSLGSSEQRMSAVSEVTAAIRCAEIAADAGMKLTLFLAGKTLIEEAAGVERLTCFPNVELGAHTWDSFRCHYVRTGLWCLFGTVYGPRVFQSFELRRTLRAFRQRIGRIPVSWRGHAYYADEHTYSLLRQAGFVVVSDRVAKENMRELLSGLWSVPINTMPDHDSVAHAGMTQSLIDAEIDRYRTERDHAQWSRISRKRRVALTVRELCGSVFDVRTVSSGESRFASGEGIALLSPETYERALFGEIESRVSTEGFATLLLHPHCMNVIDGLTLYRRVVNFCARFPSYFIGEAPRLAAGC